QSSKYCSFKNYKELKIPPQELGPLLATLSTVQWNFKFYSDGRLIKPVKMLASHDGNTNPDDIYFFININENDKDSCECYSKCECCKFVNYLPERNNYKFFVYLPNMLQNRLHLATAIFWFRQFSKIHSSSFFIEEHRWTREFISYFLSKFNLKKFLPISTDDFRSYQPISMSFLQKTLLAKSITIWDIKGNLEFYNYLINKEGNKKRFYPESLTAFGFLPQNVKFNGDEQQGWDNIFDALIKHCRKTRHPDQIIKKINLNFSSHPAPWIHTNITGMRLIYRSTTFKVDEEEGTENEDVEVRYSLVNKFDASKRFEIRLECSSNALNEEMVRGKT
uniref:Glycosyltransferase family 92 protein n=1 Tax=Meloidogyne javanica TaxID=6303 RepID=A0A915MQH9_MELJA